MLERRRLRLVQLQLMLAEQARREAMGGLADALAQEHRSADLTRRAEALAQGYASQRGAADASDVRQRSSFAHSLSQLARQSDAARRDAADQAAWQAQALAAAEHRASGLEERAAHAKRDLAAQAERREREGQATMARKLQNGGGHQPAPGQSRRSIRAKD